MFASFTLHWKNDRRFFFFFFFQNITKSLDSVVTYKEKLHLRANNFWNIRRRQNSFQVLEFIWVGKIQKIKVENFNSFVTWENSKKFCRKYVFVFVSILSFLSKFYGKMATATRQARIANGDASRGHELEPGAGHPKEKSSMRVIFLFTSYLVSSFLQ